VKKFIVYSGIDEASRSFSDPIVFSNIILREKNTVLTRKKYRDAYEQLIVYSMTALQKESIVYAKLTEFKNRWVLRVLAYGEFLLACILEHKDYKTPVIGQAATDYVLRSFLSENPIIKLRASEIPINMLPDQIKIHIEKCVEEKGKNKPPYYWVNRMLYNIKIERLITDKGAYMYVLEGHDIFGRKYAIKVPREKSSDGKPLAIGGSIDSLMDIMRGIMNSLEVALSTRETIREALVSRGYREELADYILVYREYILRPKAIVLLRDMYSEEEYSEIPPIIIEDYADKGDLETRIRQKRLDSRELAYIGIRMAGALSLTHINKYIHMDVKPQNILLISSEKEPYGYKPVLTDYVGIPHVLEKTTELKKATPEYADPLALLKGSVTFSYDLYSLGNTLYYAFTGTKIGSRLLLNLIILKRYYGLPAPLKVFLVDNPDLVPLAHKLEALFNQYSSSTRKPSISEFITIINSYIRDIDQKYFDKMRKLPERLYSIILRLLELDEEHRYPDAVAFWIDMVKALKDIGYTNLIPHNAF